jgi:hypothetical protein
MTSRDKPGLVGLTAVLRVPFLEPETISAAARSSADGGQLAGRAFLHGFNRVATPVESVERSDWKEAEMA